MRMNKSELAWAGRLFGSNGFLIFISLLIHGQVLGQIEPGTIPDGTQGETMEITESDTIRKRLSFENWNQFNGSASTLKFGGGFLYEFAGYTQDEAGKQQMDSANADLVAQFKVRDIRITMSGRLKTKRFITWKAGIMFDGPSNSWFVRETGVMVGVPELWGNIFIGRTKEGFSMNKVMNGYAGWTMERQMALDVIPILADGVKWMGFLPRQRLLWNIGVFVDWLSKDQSFSTYSWQLAARAAWLPFYSEENEKLLHLGLSYRYGEPEGEEIRVRSRPEANPAPYFVETDKFPAQHSNHVGYEVYFTSGPLMLGSEGYLHMFSSPEKDNPTFQGGDIVASYIITGESRPYSTVSGIYSFVPVRRSIFNGGPGAWEVLLRVSALDLEDGAIDGGKFWRVTPMVNWYLSENIRLELAYGYGVLDRFGLQGTTQFFQSRIQFML